MKIPDAVINMMDGNGVLNDIYAIFPIPPTKNIEIRPNVIYKLCAEKKVIHLGCTDHIPRIDMRLEDGNYIHRQLSYIASKCIGIDINEEAVTHLYKKGIKNVLAADITQPGISAIESDYWDFLLIPDVLEHIPNPANFLRSIIDVYGKYIDRYIISVPNVFGLFVNNIDTFTQEAINYDHCFWFTPYTLCKVVKATGLKTDEIFMCSYENPAESINAHIDIYKKYPLLLNTIILTAHV